MHPTLQFVVDFFFCGRRGEMNRLHSSLVCTAPASLELRFEKGLQTGNDCTSGWFNRNGLDRKELVRAVKPEEDNVWWFSTLESLKRSTLGDRDKLLRRPEDEEGDAED